MNHPSQQETGPSAHLKIKERTHSHMVMQNKRRTLPDCVSRSRSLSGIRFVCVLFGGTTLLVWSVFGNCAGTDLVGVRLGLLMRCVRACVDDIQHQGVIKGMQQTECFRAKFRPRPCGDEPIMKWQQQQQQQQRQKQVFANLCAKPGKED